MKPSSRRAGVSLLEVVIAGGVLAMGIAGVAHLSHLGLKCASDARDLVIVQSECQTRMNEMAAGVRPLQVTSGEPVAGLPDWSLSVEILPTDLPTVVSVRVYARKLAEPGAQSQSMGDAPSAGGAYSKEFVLARWLVRSEASTSPSGLRERPGMPGAEVPGAVPSPLQSPPPIPGADFAPSGADFPPSVRPVPPAVPSGMAPGVPPFPQEDVPPPIPPAAPGASPSGMPLPYANDVPPPVPGGALP